ncbi:hypothetical protein [Amycolatopsis alba]|uniref:Uncharacterized protein n=2 Tax=Amycolatopsis alba TaxID=76020 RepID=A0A229QXE5_AMYAL|nr:hypothetical protein [Amycolatopsis alba]OXM39047.1 hypothetical protein CFP75_44040 [Amycolatopsis alba DSM 44262]
MTDRYELNPPSVDVKLAQPGSELGMETLDDGNHGLVIGEPESSAYVIEGSLDAIAAFAARVVNIVDAEREKVRRRTRS